MILRRWLASIRMRLRGAVAEREVDEELRIHLEMAIEENLARGMSETEATRAARRDLGMVAVIKEARHQADSLYWLDTLLQDLRYGVRILRRTPGFTAAVVLVLALGIGAGTATFGIVHGMLLRPLPYPDADAIMFVGEARGTALPSRLPVFLTSTSMPLIQAEAGSFEQFAAYGEAFFDWASPDGAVVLRGATVSASLFSLLGAAPHLGRLFTQEDAHPDAERVAVLSYGAWTRRLGSDPGIIGTVLPLDEPRTVVGVLAEGFCFPGPESELWVPYYISPFTPLDPAAQERTEHGFSTTGLGRLRPGASPEEAAAEIRAILQRIDGAWTPELTLPTRLLRGALGRSEGIDVRVIPLREGLVGEYRPMLLALTAAAVFMLLLACINVAGLLLASGATRQRALTVCAALGAGQSRIVRQLLTESTGLGLCGGALGLGAATLVLRAVPALVPGEVVRLEEVGVDGVVLVFALGLSVAAGLAFGAVPAFYWSRFPLARTLHDGSAPWTGGFRLLRASRTGTGLATAQVALALVLLVGAGLLLRSFVGLLTVDRGYDPAGVITARTRNPDMQVRIGMMTPGWSQDLLAESRRFDEALLESADRIARHPGVTAVGLSSDVPLVAGAGPLHPVYVEGRPLPDDPDETPRTRIRLASPGYFDAMRMRLLSGRFFNRLDGRGDQRVVVVNEAFAREVFDGEAAVGQGVWVGFNATLGPAPAVGIPSSLRAPGPWRVIGVVADVHYEGLTVSGSPAEAFFSMRQSETVPRFGSAPFIAVRTTGDPLAVVPSLREAVAEAHPRATIEDVMTMDERLSAAVAEPRFHAGFAGFFALVALFLAAGGIHGLLSYAVSLRRREIGVRLALGAQRSDIVGLVVRQGAALVAVGAAAGLLAAAASSRVLEGFLYGVSSDDRLAFAGAACVLVGTMLLACWLPVRRAARIDPIEVLRFE